jgi:type IV pilus assembly protein PilV
MMKSPMKHSNSGFTLLEILVSLVILAIGLLGLAGLQAAGLKNNHSAYHRSQATQLSYDMADRMRVNVAGISFYVAGTPAASAVTGCATTSGCSAENMAKNDLLEWNNLITDALPGGVGDITQSGSIYNISVTWNDDRDGNSANNLEFETSMQP